jgi:hypothetical protein
MPRNRSGKRSRAATAKAAAAAKDAKDADEERLRLQYETIFRIWHSMSRRSSNFVLSLPGVEGYLNRDVRSESIMLIQTTLPPLQLCETRKKYLSKIREYARALEKFWATKLQDPEHLRDVLLKIKELEESFVEQNENKYFTFFNEDL